MPAAPLAMPSLNSDDLLPVVLGISLAGVALLRPVWAANGDLLDFTYTYLNPAAQRLLHLPEQPAASHQATYPGPEPAGALDFYRIIFWSGQPGHYTGNYRQAGRDHHLQVAAHRSGEQLVLSLSEAAPPAAAGQQEQLYQLLMQAPAMICVFDGPQHTFQFVNPPYQALVGSRPLVGKPIAEAMPELAGQPIFGLLDEVYRTGKTYQANELLVQLDHHNTAPQELEKRYYNFIYQARRDERDAVNGIFVFAYEVTPQVQARQQMAYQEARTNQLNEELAATNEEMAATNEELLAANDQTHTSNLELLTAQAELRFLNQELEARVADRTHTMTQALRQAERQQALLQAQEQQLHQILSQVPAAVATLEGPEHRYTFFNARYQQLVGGRAELGRPVAEAVPELAEQGFPQRLDQVYATGEALTGVEVPVVFRDSPAPRYVNYVYQPLLAAAGRPPGVLAFVLDVTERVRSRQQAAAAQAEALAAAERLARQRETYYHIFEQTPAAIAFLRGPEHRLDYFNPAYQQLFPGRLVAGRPIAELQPEAVAHGFVALLDRVYQTGETYFGYEHPLAIEQPGGQPPRQAYFDFTYQVFEEEGQPAGISVFASEATDRVRARQQHEARQHEAERQRQMLHTLFMTTPAATCIYAGPELVYELVNPSYQRIFPGRQLLGQPLLAALPELAGTAALASVQQVYRTGETAVFQEEPLHLARYENGPLEEGFYTFTYQARRNTEGIIDGVLVFAYEVTDQVRARRVVEKSEQYIRRLADAVPAMIWLTDAAGRCLYLNQQWHDYTGQPTGEGLGEGWLAMVHPDDLPATRRVFLDATVQQASFSLLYRLRRHDGRYRWAIDTGAPRFGRDGEFDGFVGTVFDIHEQKQAEQALQRLTTNLRAARDQAQALNTELQASNEQLRRTNVDLDNFIYTASHDLKAPITNIEGLAHALHDQLPTEGELATAVAPLLGMMQQSIERFQRTLDHLSDVTKLQKEHAQLLTQVALATIVEEVRLDLQPLLLASAAQLTIDVSACPTVAFAPKNLRSVVYNLLSNALKYRDPARPLQVSLRCRPEAEYVVLRVQDNGLGLDTAQQAELFTMFRRFHVGIEGSGIGLYMVKKIVENAGGKLVVTSEPGVGSVFSVYFRR